MEDKIRMVDITEDNLTESYYCGIKNPEHEGHQRKSAWMRTHFEKGLRAKVLLAEDGRQFGYIEYIPGQHAWRGVEAEGYMFIHCIWTFYKKYQRKGYGKRLIQACIDDARKEGMLGAAVIARDRPWLAKKEVFLKCGFEVVDAIPPDYELLVKKLNRSSPDPRFKKDWGKKLEEYGKGLTIIRSDQCPHIAKFAGEIAEMAEKTYKLKPRIVELKTFQDAQNAPTPYAIFAVVYDRRLLADYQISRSRFKNIMEKVL
jgi:GNAT superfamily N-acetyltransferase